jgi:hypothetical protein
MGLGEPIRLSLAVEVLLELVEVFARRSFFVRRLAPARVSELAHTSRLQHPMPSLGACDQASRERISIDVARNRPGIVAPPLGSVSDEG